MFFKAGAIAAPRTFGFPAFFPAELWPATREQTGGPRQTPDDEQDASAVETPSALRVRSAAMISIL